MTPAKFLQTHLGPGSAGSLTMGQVAVHLTPDGVELRHVDDTGLPAEDLETGTDPLEARRIGLFNGDGAYRALKGSPDLVRGWRLFLPGLEAAAVALDAFYPAALAMLAASRETPSRLRVVPMRDTLERQTGMYRYAQTISAERAAGLEERRCGDGCLRHPLWPREADEAAAAPPAPEPGILPLVCPEACNVFVADARKIAKAESEASAGD